jgi:hypothetical protein
MSWWVSLRDNEGNIARVREHQEGGTLVVGGSAEADLNVTYNYSLVTRPIEFHFHDSLDGQKAEHTIDLLQRVVDKLGDKPADNYWAPVPGNAGHAAAILLKWAKQYPEYTWCVI